MISINQNIISDILISNEAEIDILISKAKLEVEDFQYNPDRTGGKGKPRIAITLEPEEIKYLNDLINHFEDIVKGDPTEIKKFKIEFDKIISGVDMSKKHKKFKNELLKRMGYENLRNSFYPLHFEKTELKSCIYCNSQLAVSVKTINKKRSAKFQVDHFLPKSEYPCFSISFFNLLPVCGPCNGRKSAKAIDYNVYSDNYIDLQNSTFEFQLDKKSIISYRVNGDKNKLKIKFIDKKNIGFNENFDIEGIYSTQKDLAEELVLKSIIYNENYLESLKKSFKKLYPNKIPMVERLLVGNYTSVKDIHKRPMSKFTQDIARQLKIIK